jgi:hypothetical protein
LRLLEDGALTLKFVGIVKIPAQIVILLGTFVGEFDCKSKARINNIKPSIIICGVLFSDCVL